MRKLVKKILRIVLVTPKSRIIREIDRHEIISFDVYDTLIARCVDKPEEVFGIVEKVINDSSELYTPDFKNRRVKAELMAKKYERFEEISIDKIYQYFDAISNKDKIKEIELSIEENVSLPNPKGKELYEYALNSNKKIIIISDMYLSGSYIEKILNKNGYKDYYRCFVSSDFGVKKKSGRLYRIVSEESKISKEQIYHIGDNPLSDCISARMMGIKTGLI